MVLRDQADIARASHQTIEMQLKILFINKAIPFHNNNRNTTT